MSSRFPKYPPKKHACGRARIRWKSKDYYLDGPHGSPESKAHYARLAAEFATSGGLPPPKEHVTIAEVVVRWRAAAIATRGEKSRELRDVMTACAPLTRTIGNLPAADLDQKQLDRVREAMLSGSWMTPAEVESRKKARKPIGWCRSYANHQTCRIRSVWRWAEFEGLAPKGSWDHLRGLPPIPPYRKVRQPPPRAAVEDAVVEATLPHMSVVIATMVKVQESMGLRPSELTSMNAGAIIEKDGVSEYHMCMHKNFWRTAETSIAVIPPETLQIMRPWLEAAKLLGPETPLWRSNRGTAFTVEGFERHVGKACVKAGIPHWTPYQLRHSCKRRITRSHGLDHARAYLRQKSIATTDKYASQIDIETARKIANGE